jgi:hypothetical protein
MNTELIVVKYTTIQIKVYSLYSLVHEPMSFTIHWSDPASWQRLLSHIRLQTSLIASALLAPIEITATHAWHRSRRSGMVRVYNSHAKEWVWDCPWWG